MFLAGGSRRNDYTEVEIRVSVSGGPAGSYWAELSIPGGIASDRVPWIQDDIPLIAAASDPEAYGRALGASFFGNAVLGRTYGEVIAAIRARNRGLRVRLRLDSPELQAIRWERMFQPMGTAWKPIAVSGATPFSRWLPPTGWERPLPTTDRPIRVLAVAASPGGLDAAHLDPIDAAELDAFHRMFEGLPEIQATFLQSGTTTPATLDGMRAALPNTYHVVHVLCHGAVTPNGSVLYLDGPDGMVKAVPTDDIVEAFGALAKPPLLCFLSACESAARAKTGAFIPLGPALVRDGGVQAAVAMSDRVGQRTARVFAEQFYRRLLVHGMVDVATNEARALVRDAWDWGVPVLFSRLSDNQLIDFPEGRISAAYLEHTGTTVAVLDQAIGAAEAAGSTAAAVTPDGRAVSLVEGLHELVGELGKSHQVLVDVASSFREIPDTPRKFPTAFETYYDSFKRTYDGQTWVNEDTSCGKIEMLAAQLLPEVSGILTPQAYEQLRRELAILGDADETLLRFLREFLDVMDQAVERIKGLLDNGETSEAIKAKRDFEARISPSFRRSKEMLARMSSSIRSVAA